MAAALELVFEFGCDVDGGDVDVDVDVDVDLVLVVPSLYSVTGSSFWLCFVVRCDVGVGNADDNGDDGDNSDDDKDGDDDDGMDVDAEVGMGMALVDSSTARTMWRGLDILSHLISSCHSIMPLSFLDMIFPEDCLTVTDGGWLWLWSWLCFCSSSSCSVSVSVFVFVLSSLSLSSL